MTKGMTIGPARDVRAAAVDLGVANVCNAYGSTEIYGACCVTPHDWPLQKRVDSQGPALPGVRLTIRDPETGAVVPTGQPGEITVAGHVTPGYLNQPEENAKALTDAGEFRTGDLGYCDDEGNLYFVGRATEMIKSVGINISPLEVEDFLLTHPKVLEVAVVGVDDERKGQVAVAFVKVGPGAEIDEAALQRYCRDQIAAFKVPARIVVDTADFPRTDTGSSPAGSCATSDRRCGTSRLVDRMTDMEVTWGPFQG